MISLETGHISKMLYRTREDCRCCLPCDASRVTTPWSIKMCGVAVVI